MAGYSETPLSKKLGIKESSQLYLMGAPADYFEMLGIEPAHRLAKTMGGPIFFTSSRSIK